MNDAPPAVELILGDCLDVLKGMEPGSVDAVVTDPPAGIGFMGKAWDRASVMEDILPAALRESFRVAKPGAVLLCWALPRTSHWTGLAIESAGWEVQDVITHHFGTGFPKHASKLKPATEFWWLARKPGPKWLGVDECRVGTDSTIRTSNAGTNGDGWGMGIHANLNGSSSGRWPANLVLSHGPDCNGVCGEGCPVRLMGDQSGELQSGKQGRDGHVRNSDKHRNAYASFEGQRCEGDVLYGDSGTAARFFPRFDHDHDPFIYAAKASRRDRNEGCEGMEERRSVDTDWVSENRKNAPSGGITSPQTNHHPTVKSVHLMRWLCRLACPEGGTILDPFMGSGSTGKAAVLEGFRFVGVEQDPAYHAIAARRIAAEQDKTALFDRARA